MGVTPFFAHIPPGNHVSVRPETPPVLTPAHTDGAIASRCPNANIFADVLLEVWSPRPTFQGWDIVALFVRNTFLQISAVIESYRS